MSVGLSKCQDVGSQRGGAGCRNVEDGLDTRWRVEDECRSVGMSRCRTVGNEEDNTDGE